MATFFSGGGGRRGGGPGTSGWLGGHGGHGGGSAVRSRECACGRRLSAPGTRSAPSGASLCDALPVVVWALLGWWQVGDVRLHLHAVQLMPACSLSPLQELGLAGSCRRRGRR
jgi:hypothetical protein